MANPLEQNVTSPAPPNPNGGNALQQSGAPPAGGAPPPPPDHAQVVAALRHLDGIKRELKTILDNPGLGKSDLKDSIISGTTSLVADRMMSAAEAVMTLADVPKEPLQQRKWVQQHMTNAVQAERGILAHHAIGFAGQGPMPTPSADNHMEVMKSLGAQYGGKR